MMNSDKKSRRKKKKAEERKAKKAMDKSELASGKINIYHDSRDDKEKVSPPIQHGSALGVGR